MNTDLARTLESMVMAGLPIEGALEEGDLRRLVDGIGVVLNAGDEEKRYVLSHIMARQRIRMDTGTQLAVEHRPWLAARKSSIEPFFWDRYFRQLERQRWPRGVLLGLDRTTDEILDLCGDPAEPSSWKRRGLVIGDVQSGKTATYTALTCKAADSGYGLIILLAGTLENLRRQTQERLDAGFVGFDSSGELQKTRLGKRVGVGLIDQRRQATVFTSRTKDFSRQTVQALGLTLASLKGPALVVVKKNVSILKNLQEWLEDFNAGRDNKIDTPVLLIDDEADNASVNTNSPDSDPTAINERIRSILSSFNRSTYVGFTATPFANIFIHPDSQDEMLGDDLFPRDFIYSLEAPSNYFGPAAVFLDDGAEKKFLREVDDAFDLPLSHKQDLNVVLPESLIDAVAAFIVGNAIRDLRGEGATHRSMLINVSRFTAVQNCVEQLILDELTRFKNDIRNFARLPEAEARQSQRIERLFEVWELEYRDAWPDWGSIQNSLSSAALPIETRSVNQTRGARNLDFRQYDETGLRVIAVGGNSLSRGLTLEGLFVSYFHRNSKMYDTLLQMGRWFGYRDGYRDLCRIWLPQEAIDWYSHISRACVELREEVQRMRLAGLGPSDFGLAVRAHPDSLIVTARNKMRSARDIETVVSVSAQSFESVELPMSKREANWSAADDFVLRIAKQGYVREVSRLGNPMFRGVSPQEIARFLESFATADTDILFQPGALAEFIRASTEPKLAEWDVVIPNGKSDRFVEIGDVRVSPQIRRVTERKGSLIISGNKRRIGSRGIESEGMAPGLVQMVREEAGEQQVSDKAYRLKRERPLLLIHVLDVRRQVGSAPDGQPQMESVFQASEKQVVGLGLSFPEFGGEGERRVRYRANLVKYREFYPDDSDDDDEFEEGMAPSV